MAHHRLGEVCLSLGLMRSEDVDAVLAKLREGGSRARFGEIAMEMGLLDDDALARSLATQFRLNMVPRERLARLSIAPEVLELLPSGLIRERTLVPTFLDEEKRVLSLLTADPTDIPSLRAAQTAARAARLRLFVAPRDAMRELVKRLLPESADDPPALPMDATRGPSEASPRSITIVFEPDPERAGVLKRLDAVEDGGAEVVGDPEQVSAFIEANQADRVFFRRAVAAEVEPYVAAWRRLRPMIQVCEVEGWGPARRSGVPYEAARDFFLGLLEHHLLGPEPADPLDDAGSEARARLRRTVGLARELAEARRMPPALRDSVVLAALYADLDEIEGVDVPEDVRFARAATLLGAFQPPYPVADLLAALGLRVRGEAGPGGHPGAEILFTARAAAWLGPGAAADPIQALGVEAARHDADTLRALTTVVRRRALRGRVATGGRPPRPPTDALGRRGSISAVSRPSMPPPDGRPASIHGQLADLSLVDLLQTLLRARKTAVVQVLGGAEPGSVQVREGRIAAARRGVREGEEAFFALVAVEDGRFEVRFEDEGTTNLSAPGEFLLLEALRRRDEGRARAGGTGEVR